MLGIVVVHYGNDELLEQCLGSIINSVARIECSLIVVNNNRKNIGYGAACNEGYDHLIKNQKCNEILFMNNDIILNCKSLMAMIAQIRLGAQFVSPYMHYTDGRDNRESKRAYISGGCFMACASSFGALRFDERYFLYWEDVDLTYRAIKSESTVINLNCSVDHIGQHNNTACPLTRFYHTRNALYFAKKYADKFDYWLFSVYYYLEFVPKRILYFIIKFKFSTVKNIIKALLNPIRKDFK